jgi:hypothetical protein
MTSDMTFKLILILLIQVKILTGDYTRGSVENVVEQVPGIYDKLIMDTLSSFEAKLNANMLTRYDVQIIILLMNLINQRRKDLSEQVYREQPIYWYSRKGRSV